jgi:hypothetical protein
MTKLTKKEERKLLEERCEALSRRVITRGNIGEMLAHFKLKHKEGVGPEEFREAIRKGGVKGKGKLENEIREIGYQFEKILEIKEEES